MGTLGIGTLTGFLLYGVAIGASLGTHRGLYGQFREGTGAIDAGVRDHRHAADRSSTRPTPGRWRAVAGRIELDDVSFAYLPDRPVLRDISLTDRRQGRPSPWSGRRARARPRWSG